MFKIKLRIVTEPILGYKIQYNAFLFWQDFEYPTQYSRLSDAINGLKELDKALNFKSVVIYEQ